MRTINLFLQNPGLEALRVEETPAVLDFIVLVSNSLIGWIGMSDYLAASKITTACHYQMRLFFRIFRTFLYFHIVE